MTDKERSSEIADKQPVGKQPAGDKFPAAKVIESGTGLLRASRMWWLTLLCLIGALWLAWLSLPRSGRAITIHFPQGHGLKSGDAVRYRGIDVGTVADVQLNGELSGVDVHVTLNPDGGALDREGTRFWIVRPQLSLTEISGIETAVGAKYIGVSPGAPNAAHRDEFDGMAGAPADELDRGGLQLVLRSDDRHGTSPGAPVTWRGVQAGKVVSVNLSPDARHVHITIRIDRQYRRLIRSTSKFWVTSGFNVDIGLSGVKLNARSLETIIQGGISFVTLAGDTNKSVRDGSVFALAEQPQEDWLTAEASVSLIDIALPETVTVSGTRPSSMLGFSRTQKFSQTGFFLKTDSGVELITATMSDDEEATTTLTVHSQSATHTLENIAINKLASRGTCIVAQPMSVRQGIPLSALRHPTGPEDCVVVRSSFDESEVTQVVQTIDLEHIAIQSDQWAINNPDVDFTAWHGAPIIAMSDGKIIGILHADADGPIIGLLNHDSAN